MQNVGCPDAEASPFGRGVTAGDGEGKLSATEPPHGDRQPLCQSETIARLQFFGSVLALSGASRQLSQRESHYTLLASSSTLRFGTQ